MGDGHVVAFPQVNVTVTSVLFQPAAFARGDAAAVMVGAPVVCSVTEIVALPVLPAASVAAAAIWLGPFCRATLQLKFVPLIEAATLLHNTEAIGEPPAETFPVTAIGDDVAVERSAGAVIWTTGAVLSMFRTTDASADPPGPVAVPVMVWLAPSVVTRIGDGHVVAFVQVKLTVTSVLFQPLAFAAGVRLPEIVGAVLSRR